MNDLKDLDEDDDKLVQFVNDLPHVQSLKQTLVDMFNVTEELNSKIISKLYFFVLRVQFFEVSTFDGVIQEINLIWN